MKEEAVRDTEAGLLVVSVQNYVQRFHGECSSLLQLFESLHASLQDGAEKKAAGEEHLGWVSGKGLGFDLFRK